MFLEFSSGTSLARAQGLHRFSPNFAWTDILIFRPGSARMSLTIQQCCCNVVTWRTCVQFALGNHHWSLSISIRQLANKGLILILIHWMSVFVEPGILLQFNQNRPWFANSHRSSTIHERTEEYNELKSSALEILECNSVVWDNLQASLLIPPEKGKRTVRVTELWIYKRWITVVACLETVECCVVLFNWFDH